MFKSNNDPAQGSGRGPLLASCLYEMRNFRKNYQYRGRDSDLGPTKYQNLVDFVYLWMILYVAAIRTVVWF